MALVFLNYFNVILNSCCQAFWGVKRNISNKYASICSVLLVLFRIQYVFLNNDNLVHNKEI